MEMIRGKQTSLLNYATLLDISQGYDRVHIDLGTGDGRFALHSAQANPRTLVIGIDACRENLVAASRRAPANALFIIANAQALPPELAQIAQQVSINFPWGSLVEGLLAWDSAVLTQLLAVMQPGAVLDVRVNAGALAEVGWPLDEGANQVRQVLAGSGFTGWSMQALDAGALKTFPTTWAKRLAFGRDPRAVHLRAVREGLRTPVDNHALIREMQG